MLVYITVSEHTHKSEKYKSDLQNSKYAVMWNENNDKFGPLNPQIYFLFVANCTDSFKKKNKFAKSSPLKNILTLKKDPWKISWSIKFKTFIKRFHQNAKRENCMFKDAEKIQTEGLQYKKIVLSLSYLTLSKHDNNLLQLPILKNIPTATVHWYRNVNHHSASAPHHHQWLVHWGH